MVAAAARYQKQQLAAETQSSSPAAAATAPSRVYPCLTGSEISAAIQSWSTDGAAVRRLLHRVADRGLVERNLLEHAMGERGRICGVRSADRRNARSASPMCGSSPSSLEEDLECAICMIEITEGDDCLLLPCSGSHAVDSSSTPQCGSPVGGSPVESSPIMSARSPGVVRPHVFHTECISRWWTKSCRCPTCRRDVRHWLKGAPSRKRPPTLPIRRTDRIHSESSLGTARPHTPTSYSFPCGFRPPPPRQSNPSSIDSRRRSPSPRERLSAVRNDRCF